MKKHSGPNEATDKPMLQIEHSSLLELPTQQHQAVDCKKCMHPQVSAAPAALITDAQTVAFQSLG